VRNKNENLLSRIFALEACFATHLGVVDEQRRRHELILYVTAPSLRLGVDFLPASSRTSRENCGCCTRGQGCSDLLTTFKTMKTYSGILKICGRLSPITEFVHNLRNILDVYRENSWRSKWQTMSEDAKRTVSVPLLCLSK